MQPQDIHQWYARNNSGEMVPFSAFATTHWEYGSPRLERYNGIPAMQIQGEAAPGASSGESMAAVEAIAATLPPASVVGGALVIAAGAGIRALAQLVRKITNG